MTISQDQSLLGSLLAVGASVPIGSSAIVTAWGRNDMGTTQQMGISWTVRDPDGVVVEQYDAWEAWPYCPPGSEHKFDGGRFDINKPVCASQVATIWPAARKWASGGRSKTPMAM
ncbi:unnamed protein product [marine sediment metagenome]|uniref:Uncharacterized protein n=1 Tax=marine sediment metagenome TaxID=412755 RepID=X1U7S7_9ZZZZ